MSSEYKGVLRQEARPFHWEDLNQSQKDAFERIVETLEEAIAALDGRKNLSDRRGSDWNPLSLDPDRFARSAFLSGARGTGKTSVLLSLFSVLSNFEKEKGKFFSSRKGASGNEKQKSNRSEETNMDDRLENLSRRVIILPTLDLEPLPPSTNLFVALAMRIEKALKHYLLTKQEQHSRCFGLFFRILNRGKWSLWKSTTGSNQGSRWFGIETSQNIRGNLPLNRMQKKSNESSKPERSFQANYLKCWNSFAKRSTHQRQTTRYSCCPLTILTLIPCIAQIYCFCCE